MLKIWGRTNSTNVKKVLWCAHEAGLAYERIDAGLAHGVVDTPAFRALNPNGVIPVVEDGDLVMWESNAIVRYLSARYSAGNLWHEDPAERVLADRWMDWATAAVTPAFVPLFINMVRRSPEARDLEAVQANLAKCSALLKIADGQLARQPFLSGQGLGMGDIPLGCIVYAWFEMDIERPDLPHLRAWYERLLARPAYVDAVCIGLS